MKNYEVVGSDYGWLYVKKDEKIFKIPDQADVESWKSMSNCWSKDRKGLYCYSSKVYKKLYPIIDFSTLEIIAEIEPKITYFKDKNNVYIAANTYLEVIQNTELDSFEVIDMKKAIAKDFHYYYYFHRVIPFDYSKAQFLNDDYCIAGDKIYLYYTNEIVNADVESFKVLHENISKDKHNVYFRDQVIESADSATFHFLEGCINGEYYLECDNAFYAKDKNYGYFIRTIKPNVKIIKSKSIGNFHFKVINNEGYAFDDEYRYYFGERKKIKTIANQT